MRRGAALGTVGVPHPGFLSHCSPRRFQQFDASNVGTGQGQSKCGWGLNQCARVRDVLSMDAFDSSLAGSVF